VIPLSPSSLRFPPDSSSQLTGLSPGRQGTTSAREVVGAHAEGGKSQGDAAFPGQLAVQSSHPQRQIAPTEMASGRFQCNFHLTKYLTSSFLFDLPDGRYQLLLLQAE